MKTSSPADTVHGKCGVCVTGTSLRRVKKKRQQNFSCETFVAGLGPKECASCRGLACKRLVKLMQNMEAIRPHLEVARTETTRWLGDWHPLVRQIAPGEGVTQPPASSPKQPAQTIVSTTSLHAFLLNYKLSVLLPFELPAVRQGCEFTQRGETNELLELDRSLVTASWLEPYEHDSRAAGRLHLERLKPLRDQRGVQRYIAAVDEGTANGWHLLVAGVALGLYALPLRQGLMDYALHTFWNVVGQAGGPLKLTPNEARELVNELCADLPRQIQQMFPAAHLEAV